MPAPTEQTGYTGQNSQTSGVSGSVNTSQEPNSTGAGTFVPPADTTGHNKSGKNKSGASAAKGKNVSMKNAGIVIGAIILIFVAGKMFKWF